jgi:hypothetical protein
MQMGWGGEIAQRQQMEKTEQRKGLQKLCVPV